MISEDPVAMIDVFSTDESGLNSIGTYLTVTKESNRFARTSSDGSAKFKTFSLMDVKDYACVKFRFVLGEPGMMMISDATKELCFMNDFSFKITNTMSKKIRDNQEMRIPPIIEISRMTNGETSTSGPFFLAGLISSFDRSAIESRWQKEMSDLFLAGNFCYFYSEIEISLFCQGKMSVVTYGNSEKPFSAQIIFSSLLWSKPR